MWRKHAPLGPRIPSCRAQRFEESIGSIRIADRDVTWAEPKDRGIGMVFQSYALFPNMSVGENIAYGLKIRKVDTAARQKKVAELIALVHLDGKVRSIEVTLHPLRHVFKISGQSRLILGANVMARAKAEPLRPGWCEFREQAGGELLHCVRCRAIEELIGEPSGWAELGA